MTLWDEDGLRRTLVCSMFPKFLVDMGPVIELRLIPAMAQLRFHWDFFGPDAQPTAEHFLRHLDQFCAREGVSGQRHWTTDQAVRVVATMECDEKYLAIIRDALRPKRADRVLE